MPIFFQQELDGDTRLGVWHIEEGEEFFQQRVEPQRHVSHPHKKRQHLAGRYLLQHLFADFPTSLIRVADTRKPFLEDEAYHFSISHCADFAAAIVSRSRRVGIDIEVPTDKVERIRHKFLSGGEEALLAQFARNGGPLHQPRERTPDALGTAAGAYTLQGPTGGTGVWKGGTASEAQLLTLLWSCKEAIFKWYGLGSVDFRRHMVLKSITQDDTGGFRTSAFFRKGGEVPLTLHSIFFGESCLSYVCTPP